ncbi:MAG: hypothetical protein HQ582_03985 [Planctomycetes bacterium]|nr:hypothetical protein [Planctomycetota bacterium]
MKEQLGRLQRGGLLLQSAFLGLVVALAYGLVAPVAGYLAGGVGLAAAAVAAGLCLAGATVALLSVHLFRGSSGALAGVLLGMAARMVIPLGGGFALHSHGGPLAEAGLLYYLLVFYPITLALETWLSLPETGSPERYSGASMEKGCDG